MEISSSALRKTFIASEINNAGRPAGTCQVDEQEKDTHRLGNTEFKKDLARAPLAPESVGSRILRKRAKVASNGEFISALV